MSISSNVTPAHLVGKTVGQLREQARKDAREVLDTHWRNQTVPVDPVHIARALGASVFLSQLGDDTTGMIIGDPNGANIYVDQDNALVRQRFTVAHEVGHLVSHEEELSVSGVGFVDNRSSSGSGTASEVYANEFAGELLMPRRHLQAAIDSGITSNIRLASMFNVSLQAMSYRRQVLGI